MRAYIAGVIDADGYIGIIPYNNRKNTYIPRIQIKMTNDKVIRIVKDIYGGGTSFERHSESNINHKDSYNWYICKRSSIIRMLEDIEPYLTIKLAQCKLVLAFYSIFPERAQCNTEDKYIYYNMMKVLNERGAKNIDNQNKLFELISGKANV